RGTAARLSEAARCPWPTVVVPDAAADLALTVAHDSDHPCWDGLPRVLGFLLLRCHEGLGARWPALCDDLTTQLRTALRPWLDTVRRQLPRLADVHGQLAAARAAVDRTHRDLEAADARLTALGDERAVCAAEAQRSEQTAGVIVAEVDRQWQRHVEGLYRQVAAAPDVVQRESLALAVLLTHHLRDRIGDD
ncbi:MAG: hypothetical protein ACRDRK_16860, partial [Pseudonocardia sp.]